MLKKLDYEKCKVCFLIINQGVYLLKINKLAVSLLASTILTGMSGAGMMASAHVSALAAKYPTVILLTLYHGPQNNAPNGYPNFTPAYFSAPANSRVEFIINSYDDGPGQFIAGDNKVKGTVGGVEWVDGKKTTVVNKNDVAHTLTIPGLGLNIPIPAKTAKEPYVTVKAFYNAGKAGTYSWQCMVNCGSGSSGWEGAMSPATGKGWMFGTFTLYNLKDYQH